MGTSDEDAAAKKARKAARKAAKAAKAAAAAAAAADPAPAAKEKKQKKAKKAKEKKRKKSSSPSHEAAAAKKQRREPPQRPPPQPPQPGGTLRFWRVKLSGLPAAASAEEVASSLASTPLSWITATMLRLPKDATMLQPGEAMVTLKSEEQAESVRALGGSLSASAPGVSVALEDVAAGQDEEVFVRYLPFAATSDEVRELFATHGSVTRVKLMPGREPGLNSGVGFVSFADGATAAGAVAALDGHSWMGRSLAVCLAKERKAKRPHQPPPRAQPSPTARPGAAAAAAAKAPLVVPAECRSVLVENLVYGCSQRDVRALPPFRRATKVVLLGKLGKARVGFLSAADVRQACESAAGVTQAGRLIRVRPELPEELTADGGHGECHRL